MQKRVRTVTLARRMLAQTSAVAFALGLLGSSARAAHPLQTGAIPLTQIPAARAAKVLRALYRDIRVAVEENGNAVIVTASPERLNEVRSVVAGIDVRSPLAPTVEAIGVGSLGAHAVIARIAPVFPSARILPAPGGHAMIVEAAPADMAQIHALVAALEAPPPVDPAAHPPRTTEAFHVMQARPQTVAHAIATSIAGLRVDVSGSNVLMTGAPQDVERGKALAAELDEPPASVRYTQLYRIHAYDASSIGDFLNRSYPGMSLQVDKSLNAITVLGSASEQQRVAQALAQVDVPNAGQGLPIGQPGASSEQVGGPGGSFQVYTLKAAVPGLNGAASTSANDIAQSVTQALQQQAGDLRITVVPSTNQLILSGSPYSLELARQLIDQLDVAQKLVVLDTQILEIDATYAQDLGLSFSSPQVLSTTYSEETPPTLANGTAQRLLGLAPLTRTPLSLGVQLSLAIQQGKGRVLANPRITTISGRTATIRAGDTISVATTAGGGAGTVATTQLQTFQTGVTLDITPIVNSGNFITILLHPTVNSETGLLNNIPQISTRDTQTTVELQEDETLVIGGLIQDSSTKTVNKIPLLGDIPLLGQVFRENIVNNEHDELVIVVTPHVLTPGMHDTAAGRGLPQLPPSQTLPTLPPSVVAPPAAPISRTPAVAPVPAPLPVPYAQAATPAPTLNPAAAPVSDGTAVPGGPATTPVPGGPLPPNAAVPGGPVVATAVPGGPVRTSGGLAPSAAPLASAQPTPASYGSGATVASAAPATPTPLGVRGNMLVYGSQPASTTAAQTDPVKIFYADLSPAIVYPGESMRIDALATSNTTRMTLSGGTLNLQLSQSSSGAWLALFPLPPGSPGGTMPLTLTAYRGDGTAATIALPITVTP